MTEPLRGITRPERPKGAKDEVKPAERPTSWKSDFLSKYILHFDFLKALNKAVVVEAPNPTLIKGIWNISGFSSCNNFLNTHTSISIRVLWKTTQNFYKF